MVVKHAMHIFVRVRWSSTEYHTFLSLGSTSLRCRSTYHLQRSREMRGCGVVGAALVLAATTAVFLVIGALGKTGLSANITYKYYVASGQHLVFTTFYYKRL